MCVYVCTYVFVCGGVFFLLFVSHVENQLTIFIKLGLRKA